MNQEKRWPGLAGKEFINTLQAQKVKRVLRIQLKIRIFDFEVV